MVNLKFNRFEVDSMTIGQTNGSLRIHRIECNIQWISNLFPKDSLASSHYKPYGQIISYRIFFGCKRKLYSISII
ncbi:hypothetical protein QR98_0062290 [Sarcoptes scabiei]|uniref:Uncharacterized protein n=1 Tax=Sarcoptes scabiei TaxID=52283 RepID=A0A132ABA1_SARSC|nr:hypothetical protein QR98_0062290 [Sarcoptes scabiei]